MTRFVEAGSGCRCTVQICDWEPGEEPSLCELGFPDCEDGAVVLLTGPFWASRLGGRYCFACQSCMLEHAETCERRGVPR